MLLFAKIALLSGIMLQAAPEQKQNCRPDLQNQREALRAMPDSYFYRNIPSSGLQNFERDLLIKTSIAARNARIYNPCRTFAGLNSDKIVPISWAQGESFGQSGINSLNQLFYDLNTDVETRARGDYIIVSSGFRSFHDQLSVWGPNLRRYYNNIKSSLAQYIEYDEVPEIQKPVAQKPIQKKQTETLKTKEAIKPKYDKNGILIVEKDISSLEPQRPPKMIKTNPHYNAQAISVLRSYAGARFAFPGYSNHQKGDAVDFQIIDKNGNRLSAETAQGNINAWCRTHTFKWLVKNAPKYGFIQAQIDEPWHWEYHPDLAKQKERVKYYAPSCQKYLN